MKFVHIADVHFDMPMIALSGNRELIKSRRIEQKKAFHDVVQFVKTEKVDCFFIAGDLFEQKFVEKSTIEYIISNLKLIPDVNIFITPGNHDPFIKKSPYEIYDWPENVTIFKKEYGMISLDDTDVYGIGFEDYEMDEDDISKIEIENPEKVNILITHGTLNGAAHQYHDIKEKDLKKFDYVALGHIHEKKVDESHIIYPGSLLSCGFDEPGEHGFIYGEITKDECKTEFRSLDYKEFKKIEFDVSNIENESELFSKIEIGEDIYEIKLYGTRKFQLDDFIENLKKQYSNICKLKDQTRTSYNFESIKNEENLKGIFTRKYLAEIESMNEEEKNEAFKTLDMIYQMM